MKKIIEKLILLFLIYFVQNGITLAQELDKPLTAKSYWQEEQHLLYKRINKKIAHSDSLTSEEKTWLRLYNNYLANYFDKLSPEEKETYFRKKENWNNTVVFNQHEIQKTLSDSITIVQDDATERKHFTMSTIYGFCYGGAIDALLELESGAALALPLLTAGGTVLLPVLWRSKNGEIPVNSMLLSSHGRFMGAAFGTGLACLLTDIDKSDGKFPIFLGLAGSIAAGHYGFYLGRHRNWSEGKAGLFIHYSKLCGGVGLLSAISMDIEEPKAVISIGMLSALGGYYLANTISRKNDFTRGDVIATEGITLLNTALSLAIITETNNSNNSSILIPAIGAVSGTLIGHYLTKNTKFTVRQGRRIEMASTGGAIIGLGIASLTESKSITPYYLIPYITGTVVYGLVFNNYKKKNNFYRSNADNSKRSFDFDFSPQNYFLNQKLQSKLKPNSRYANTYLPIVSMKMKF